MLLVLIGLGTWQVQRMSWKAELIDRIQERTRAAPVPLPAEIATPDDWEFRPVTVTGRYIQDKSLFTVARPRQGQAGFDLITPLARDDGPPVLVNRGFVPMDRRTAAASDRQPDGEVTVVGVARVPHPPGLFQPDNRPGADTWMRVDIPAMSSVAGLATSAPVVVELLPTGGVPGGNAPVVELPNNHLSYALTWYGLAVVMVVVFALSYRGRRSE